jgi:hypothetical protein
MKPSSGNTVQRPAGEPPQTELRPSAPRAQAEPRPDYRKPELKRLGLLRSVTGGDLKW